MSNDEDFHLQGLSAAAKALSSSSIVRQAQSVLSDSFTSLDDLTDATMRHFDQEQRPALHRTLEASFPGKSDSIISSIYENLEDQAKESVACIIAQIKPGTEFPGRYMAMDKLEETLSLAMNDGERATRARLWLQSSIETFAAASVPETMIPRTKEKEGAAAQFFAARATKQTFPDAAERMPGIVEEARLLIQETARTAFKGAFSNINTLARTLEEESLNRLMDKYLEARVAIYLTLEPKDNPALLSAQKEIATMFARLHPGQNTDARQADLLKRTDTICKLAVSHVYKDFREVS